MSGYYGSKGVGSLEIRCEEWNGLGMRQEEWNGLGKT